MRPSAAPPSWSGSRRKEWNYEIRPKVISGETAARLQEYLSFRHVVRNIYAFEFDADRVERLVRGLAPTFEAIREELTAFAGVLERINGARDE
ncbi:MAG: hypothetical protein HY900_15035 [Deltaproteobacteria bacterium]|nr:hypothetical protein [Deltaproteobacteria bacterium]